MYKAFLLAVGLSFCSALWAEDKPSFEAWLIAFKAEASQNNISQKTIEASFENAKYLPQVIILDRAQPEFISPFLTYVKARVNPKSIATGRQMLQKHQILLSQLEAQYGVPKQVLVAFWGLETAYGKNQGDFGLPSSLMTLAYEGRRAAFFRSQLMDALRIVDAGNSTVAGLRGSWAGAMGHMQFMPTTLLQYGVDGDDDGVVHIKTSLADAFASAANYLESVGWDSGAPIATEVKLPEGFDYALAQLEVRKTSNDWEALGVRQIDNSALPKLENTAIILPQGWQGPAFMVARNFDTVMDWNHSINYALSISHLADQLVQDKLIKGGELAEKEGMTFNQMWALQGRLNLLGYDCGSPDGFPGLKTQQAIRQYQAANKLPQDGYASPSLYLRLTNQ